MTNAASFHSKQDHPGSPLFCSDHEKYINPNDDTLGKEIYHGLVGIAFETQEESNLEVTKFVNVQIHREWIEAIINEKEIAIRIWSRSMGMNHHNNHRISGGNSRTTAMNLMICFNLFFMLSFQLKFSYPLKIVHT